MMTLWANQWSGLLFLEVGIRLPPSVHILPSGLMMTSIRFLIQKSGELEVSDQWETGKLITCSIRSGGNSLDSILGGSKERTWSLASHWPLLCDPRQVTWALWFSILGPPIRGRSVVVAISRCCCESSNELLHVMCCRPVGQGPSHAQSYPELAPVCPPHLGCMCSHQFQSLTCERTQ